MYACRAVNSGNTPLKINSTFKPAWWLRNSHLQTLWAGKVRRVSLPDTLPERLELPDGDFVDLNCSTRINETTAKRSIVCLFHGMAGSLKSGYASAVFTRLEQHGYDVVFMHARGCSGEPNRKAHSYHSGYTADMGFLIETLAQRYPDRRIHAVGYSLSANALLKYLGESGSSTALTSAVAVAPPLVLKVGAERLNNGFSRIYQHYLLNGLKTQLAMKRELYPALDLPQNVDDMKTFWVFDDEVTAPLHGFKDVHDYYTRASSRPFLPKIRCRTHIIHSSDDPFYTTEVIPETEELPESVTFETTTHGGHVGFVGGSWPWKVNYWLDERVPEILLTNDR